MRLLGPLLPAAAALLAGGGSTNHVLEGTCSGSAACTADLVVNRTLAGTATGSAALTAELIVNRTLAGTATGAGTLTADLVVDRTLAGTATGSASLTAELVVNRTLAGTCTGSGSLTAELIANRTLAGTCTGSASLAAELIVNRTLAGTCTASATLTADLVVAAADFQRTFPASSVEWSAAFPGIAAPSHIWTFQEASGAIDDKIGTDDLALTGSALYRETDETEPTDTPRYNVEFPTTGSGDYFGLTDTTVGNITAGTGWTLWLRFSSPDTGSTARGLVTKAANFPGWSVLAYDGGGVRFDIRDGTNTFRWTSLAAYDDGNFHDVVIVYDPGSTLFRLIVDQTQITRASTGFLGISASGSGKQMRVGAPNGATVLAGTGISYVALWPGTALTFAQARLLYTEPWAPDFEEYNGALDGATSYDYEGELYGVGYGYGGDLESGTDYTGVIDGGGIYDYTGDITPQTGDDMQFSMVVGDRSPSLTRVLRNSVTGSPVDLATASGVTYECKIRDADGDIGALKTGTCTFAADATGVATIAWAAGDVDAPGIMMVRFIATFTGKTQHFPSTGQWFEFPVSA